MKITIDDDANWKGRAGLSEVEVASRFVMCVVAYGWTEEQIRMSWNAYFEQEVRCLTIIPQGG